MIKNRTNEYMVKGNKVDQLTAFFFWGLGCHQPTGRDIPTHTPITGRMTSKPATS